MSKVIIKNLGSVELKSTTVYQRHMESLWGIAGEIGAIGETDARYAAVYQKLSGALDIAEITGLIVTKESVSS